MFFLYTKLYTNNKYTDKVHIVEILYLPEDFVLAIHFA